MKQSAFARVIDLEQVSVRALNQALHDVGPESNATSWQVVHPRGRHALAVGVDAEITVEIEGHVGYYCAGMNKRATVVVHGNVGVGVAENMMSGSCMCWAMPARRRGRPRAAGCW